MSVLRELHDFLIDLLRNPSLLPAHARFILRGNVKAWRIYTHMTIPERILLYQRGLACPPGASMVEIGSYLGASSCFLAAAAHERRGRVYCVDTWHNNGMTEGRRDTYAEFCYNTRGYAKNIVPLRMLSEEACRRFHGSVHLLFLDGDHSYQGVRTDLECWLPRLEVGGWLLLHDYGWAEGVRRAVKDLVIPIQVGEAKILPNLYSARVNPKRSTR